MDGAPSTIGRRALPPAHLLLAVLVAAGAVLAAITAAFGAGHAERARVSQSHERMRGLAERVASRAAPLLERSDALRLAVLATSVADLAGSGVRVIVVDRSGLVALDTGVALGGQSLPLEAANGVLNRPLDGVEHGFEVIAPSLASSGGVGEVRIRYREPGVRASFSWSLFGFALLAFVGVAGLASLFVHHGLERVRRSYLVARHLARGGDLEAGSDRRSVHAVGSHDPLADLEGALHELEHQSAAGGQRLEKTYLELIDAVVRSLEQRGFSAVGHGERCWRQAQKLAERLGLDDESRRDLELACRYHEIGKVGVRPSVFNKSGPLSDVERDSLRQHPLRGARLLAGLESLSGVATIVRHMYERYDGSGFPDALRGDRVPIGSRILGLVIAHDHLATQEIDGGRLSSSEAVGLLCEGAGTQFDPELLDVLDDCVSTLPAGFAGRGPAASGVTSEGEIIFRDLTPADVDASEEDADAILAWGELELEVLPEEDSTSSIGDEGDDNDRS